MKKVAIIVGHSDKSRGASNAKTGETEWNYNNNIARKIHGKLLAKKVEPVIIYRTNGYSALPYEINRQNPSLIISLHCNAFDSSASGCEMLYYHSSKASKSFATILQDKVNKVLGNKNRGIKPKHSEDRGGHILKSTNAPCVITEPFFIDNDSELKNAEEKEAALVNAYVEAIVEAVRV